MARNNSNNCRTRTGSTCNTFPKLRRVHRRWVRSRSCRNPSKIGQRWRCLHSRVQQSQKSPAQQHEPSWEGSFFVVFNKTFVNEHTSRTGLPCGSATSRSCGSSCKRIRTPAEQLSHCQEKLLSSCVRIGNPNRILLAIYRILLKQPKYTDRAAALCGMYALQRKTTDPGSHQRIKKPAWRYRAKRASKHATLNHSRIWMTEDAVNQLRRQRLDFHIAELDRIRMAREPKVTSSPILTRMRRIRHELINLT